MNYSYHRDIEDAALSDACFDTVNSKEIADTHGVCPEHVLKDIEKYRLAWKDRSIYLTGGH